MPAAIMSPNGVVDFLQVEQQSIEKDLNSSFIWTECPIPASPSKKTKKKKTTAAAATAATTKKLIKDQISQARKRLAWLKEQGLKDKEDYEDQLKDAKSEMRKQIFRKFGPLLNQNNNSEEHEGQVLETTKVIGYLREDNARLREDMKGLQRSIAMLTQKNKELEAANASVKSSYQDLLDHVEGLTAVQGKIQSNVKVFKEALVKMKQEYSKRTSFCNMETKTVGKYESGLAKVLAQVRTANNPVLLAELFDIVGEGGAVARQGRETHLAKVGLTMDVKQLFQTQKLLDPELLIAEQRKKDARDDPDASSSDDDSSDDDSDFE
jgi:chromosome segregation ATPase